MNTNVRTATEFRYKFTCMCVHVDQIIGVSLSSNSLASDNLSPIGTSDQWRILDKTQLFDEEEKTNILEVN